MKKLFLTLALVLASVTMANAQLSVGAGYIRNSINYKNTTTSTSDGTTTTSTTAKTYNFNGFYVGLGYQVAYYNGVGVTPSLQYVYGVSKDNDRTSKESYLAMPINVSMSFPIVDGFDILPFLGPTLAYGISSTYTNNGETELINKYDRFATYKRFDILFGVGVAFDIVDMFRISCGFNFGLLNRIGGTNSKLRSRDFHAGVAYLF